MLSVEPTGTILGATLKGIDLKQDLSPHDFATILRALGEYGVLRFPGQWLDAAELKAFSARFGEIQVLRGNANHEPGMPEVTILSNVKKDGKLIGAPDAGQSWHTDMTYSQAKGFVNVRPISLRACGARPRRTTSKCFGNICAAKRAASVRRCRRKCGHSARRCTIPF